MGYYRNATAERSKRMAELYDKGYTTTEIAERFGITSGHIKRTINNYKRKVEDEKAKGSIQQGQ